MHGNKKLPEIDHNSQLPAKEFQFNRKAVFQQQRETSSKRWVPFIPDADVGADDFSAQRCRKFCHMQGLIAVESHGQVCVGGTLGHFAGISIDAAGQVYGQNESPALAQNVH